MRRLFAPLFLAAIAAASLPTIAANGPDPTDAAAGGTPLRAGVGVADMTWHVGAGSGQHATAGNGLQGVATGDDVDPYHHGTKQAPTYGVHSRTTARALVIEGTNGERVALVKTDNYLAQDLLARRVAQILDPALGIPHDRIIHSASHNHSSPYYSTPAAGVWVFQDAWDVRAFEYQARRIAAAITTAATSLKPARIGATTIDVGPLKGNVAGRSFSDDGSPFGYPVDFGDHGLVVLRVDDITNSRRPTPIATWMNYGQHPESLETYDLITADFLAPLERMVDRATGSTLVFSQGDVGSAEGPSDNGDRNVTLPDGTQRAWYHTGFAQSERFARNLADKVIEGWTQLGAGGGTVPMTTDIPVDVFDGWIPGPVSHPYPAANACSTDPTLNGDIGVGTAADCTRPGFPEATKTQADLVRENLEEHGIHVVPENYDVPSFGAVEENARIHLQAVRLGDILLASCSCEAQVDLILNLESRTDKVRNNIWDGFDWTSEGCTQQADKNWTCTVADNTRTDIPAASIDHMRDQVHRDALGWDDIAYAPYANAENPDDIKGNFTKNELDETTGYALTVGLGHTGDYVGYTVSYREFMARDHYRKTLTSYGPHTADYMVSRLVRMAASMNGGPAYDPFTDEPLGAVAEADEARQAALAVTVGQLSSAAYDGYEATLADDVAAGQAVTQPSSIQRFGASTFSWNGGNTWIDNPAVRVERFAGSTKGWIPFADQSGEVQTMVQWPVGPEGLADARTGSFTWKWTANFEAFDAAPSRIGQTPAGQYRFVVDGQSRTGRATVPYRLTSQPFTVSPWTGLTVQAVAQPDGSVVIPAAVTYPRSYSGSPFRFVDTGESREVCRRCSFRPWARTGRLAKVEVRVKRAATGVTDRVLAVRSGDSFVADTHLSSGDVAYIAPGQAVDTWGERNGSRLEVVR